MGNIFLDISKAELRHWSWQLNPACSVKNFLFSRVLQLCKSEILWKIVPFKFAHYRFCKMRGSSRRQGIGIFHMLIIHATFLAKNPKYTHNILWVVWGIMVCNKQSHYFSARILTRVAHFDHFLSSLGKVVLSIVLFAKKAAIGYFDHILQHKECLLVIPMGRALDTNLSIRKYRIWLLGPSHAD